jgi:hypothetical protein
VSKGGTREITVELQRWARITSVFSGSVKKKKSKRERRKLDAESRNVTRKLV